MKGALASKRTGEPGTAGASRRPIRLMIVDDSMVARAVLSRMIHADPEFEIVAVAGTGEDAIVALGHVDVDVILLDLEMPGAGGLKSIPKIIAAANGAPILIVSTLAEEGAEETVAALALGAADTLPKPGTGRFAGRFSEVLHSKVRALATRPSAPVRAAPQPAVPVETRPAGDGNISLIAIGASTGGIHALATFFDRLPARTGVPILVTQHLPPPFMQVFARQLAAAAKREATVAEDGMVLLPDRIVVAPGDAHLMVDRIGDKLIARLSRVKASSGCMPSVDPMLSSAGDLLGASVLGIILTGMGRDGLEGSRRLVSKGGSVIAQDEASSAVWGMPRSVAEAGLACAILPPDKIARRVASMVEEAVCK